MSDATARALVPVRSHGAVDLAFARRHGRTAMRRADQRGCLRVRVPRSFGSVGEAVLMNTAGGLACGDRLDQAIAWEADARFAVTTQACERVYRAVADGAAVATRIAVAAGAIAEWLPQETILFDGARLTRTLDIDLADDARLLAVEAVVMGRTAMGEKVRSGLLDDRWRVRRAGRLVYADALRLEGDVAAAMARGAVAPRAAAFATILCVAADSALLRDTVRAVLPPDRGAASAWDGMLAVRLVAPDGGTLRTELLLVLAVLRGGSMPRLWSC